MADLETLIPISRSVAAPSRGPGLMAYLDFGPPQRPVDAVFLHANGFNALTYRRILAPLAMRYRILMVDQRGHGATSLDTDIEGRRDWLDLRDDLLGFLDALDLHHVVLAGHSMGATTALLAASAEPSRCRGLALFDPVVLPPRSVPIPSDSGLIQTAGRRRATFPSRQEVIRSYQGRGAFKRWPDDVLSDYVEAGFRDLPSGDVTLACTPAWEASGFSAQGHDPWEAFGRTTCPVNILRAAVGSTFHTPDADVLNRENVNIVTVAGSTHFLPMERPELVRSVLKDTIETTDLPEKSRTSAPA